MQPKRRLQTRLGNIRAVEPIFRGLETISLGNHAAARKRQREVEAYQGRLCAIIDRVAPHAAAVLPAAAEGPTRAATVVVVGSERGLCGVFNQEAIAFALRRAGELAGAGVAVRWITLGARAERLLHRRGIGSVLAGRLSMTALPPYALACRMVERWLRDYERRELDRVEVVYNAYRGAGAYAPASVELLPPAELAAAAPAQAGEVIIETDATALYARAVQLWLSARLYALLLESAAAEHSARYRVLQGAGENADRLIVELRRELQQLRRDEITAEMADLIAGSGLLDRNAPAAAR